MKLGVSFFIKKVLYFLVFTVCIVYLCPILYYNLIIDWEEVSANTRNSSEFEKNKDFDVFILGSSRARKVAKAWKENNSLELSLESFTPGGGGIDLLSVYSRHFFENNNKASNVIYMLDPFVLASNKFDIPNLSLERKFDFQIFISFLKTFGIKWALKSLNNAKTIFNHQQQRINAQSLEIGKSINYSSFIPDSLKISKRLTNIYSPIGNMNQDEIANQKIRLSNLLDLIAKYSKNSNVIISISPTLLGDQSMYDDLKLFLRDIEKNYDLTFLDSYEIYNNSKGYKYFEDVDHLNFDGCKEYISNEILENLKI